MTDLPQDRPLVTFAIFAFNQEAYIRDAVEGALSQTYSPLEIILSDDCSSDGTYEIMREIAGAYDGPHSVTLRRSANNLGLIAHINDAAEDFSGEIVVMAAGDDISVPCRVERLIDVFRARPTAFSVCSDVADIDCSAPISQHSKYAEIISLYETVMAGGGVGLGAAYAYRRQCFFWPAKMSEDLYSEDRILPLRAAILGEALLFPERLVYYRRSPLGSAPSLTAMLIAEGKVPLKFQAHVKAILWHLNVAQSEKRLTRLEAQKCAINFKLFDQFLGRKLTRRLPGRLGRIMRRIASSAKNTWMPKRERISLDLEY